MADCTIRRFEEAWVEVILPSGTYAGELGKAHSIMLGQLGHDPATISNDDVYQVIARDDEIVLRAKVTRPENPAAWRFAGIVTDAGGGKVTITVDRDTDSYPICGDRALVEVLPR